MEKMVSPCVECYRKDRKVCSKSCLFLEDYKKILNETVGYPHECLGISSLEHMGDGCFWIRPKMQEE